MSRFTTQLGLVLYSLYTLYLRRFTQLASDMYVSYDYCTLLSQLARAEFSPH